MKVIFLSDAHLNDDQTDTYRNLLSFFQEKAGKVDRIYIVGDFFDFWFCRPAALYPPFRKMVECLESLREAGTDVVLFEGNHDFFLHDFFGPRGFITYPDGADIILDDKKIYVAHGDRADRDNWSYMAWRGFLRSPIFYRMQQALPPPLLWSLARKCSRLSRRRGDEGCERLAGKIEAYAFEKLDEGYDGAVFGHCHRPAIKEQVSANGTGVLVTLGDWSRHCSYVMYEYGSFRPCYYRGNGPKDRS